MTTFARPASVRSVIADELPPDAVRSGELAVVEMDLPGTERLLAESPSRVFVFRATFPPTAAELVKSELRRLRTEGQKQKPS